MAQFTLNWDNSEVLANSNSINQQAGYRQKTVGGSFITAGFTPSNPLSTSANTTQSPVLTDNVVYEFRVLSLCTQNGPSPNDNGIIESMGFSCIIPTLEYTAHTCTAQLNVSGTDISKAIFTLRKASDNSIASGPTTVIRSGNNIQTIATGLLAATNYYWQIVLVASVQGIDVLSSSPGYLNSVCGPYSFATADIVHDYIWIENTSTCETDGGFSVVTNITGLSSPDSVWYDSITNRMYCADLDITHNNIFWFNPLTATSSADFTYSSALATGNLERTAIDPVHRRIYLTGRDSGGMLVYDIATDAMLPLVAFGTNGAFRRTLLVLTDNYIYCNDGGTSIIKIDRTTLTIVSTIAVSGIPSNSHFNTGPFIIAGVGTELWVVSNNATPSTVGVYDSNLTTLITSITLPGVAVFSGGKFWQNIFYDTVGNAVYVSDIGSSKRFRIDTSTKAIISSQQVLNKAGKNFVSIGWLLNPVTNDLLTNFQCLNTPSDAGIKRSYLEDRTTNIYEDMYVGDYYRNLAGIPSSSVVVGASPGNAQESGAIGWGTDGTITILSNDAGPVNTGNKVVLTLKEVDHADGDAPTGDTKSNSPDDPDYIAPSMSIDDCPIEVDLSCPTQKVVSLVGATLYWDLALPSTVIENTAIAKIQVYAYNTDTASVEGSPTEFTYPVDKYNAGSFTGLGGTNYSIRVVYLSSSDAVLATC